MFESLLEAGKSFGPLFIFMISPILIPVIVISISAMGDRVRGKK